MGKGGTTPKKWKTKESRCCYHSKVYTQVVCTTCLPEILVNHYFHMVLAIREFWRLKQEANEVPTNPIQDSRVNLLEEGGNDTV
jgi:hypothetical protein